MPQFQEQRKNQVRIRVANQLSSRAYMVLMRKSGGKMQALPGDVFLVQREYLTALSENNIPFEEIARD